MTVLSVRSACGLSKHSTFAAVGLVSLLLLVMAACGTKPTASREQLVASLVQRGDRARAQRVTRETARSAYRFAAYYAPHDAAIASKLSADWDVGIIGYPERVSGLVQCCLGASSKNARSRFPQSTPGMDIVNLRMLLDEKVVGDLSYTCADGRSLWATFPPNDSASDKVSDRICMFTSEPQLSVSEIRQIYGAPSSDGGMLPTYGIFRLVTISASENHKVDLVVFPPFPPK